jgi:hypothetical protein
MRLRRNTVIFRSNKDRIKGHLNNWILVLIRLRRTRIEAGPCFPRDAGEQGTNQEFAPKDIFEIASSKFSQPCPLFALFTHLPLIIFCFHLIKEVILLAGGFGAEAAPERRFFPLGDQWRNGTQKRIRHETFYGP